MVNILKHQLQDNLTDIKWRYHAGTVNAFSVIKTGLSVQQTQHDKF